DCANRPIIETMTATNQDPRHYVLSEVHHLLSVASASDFLAASRLCKPENVRRALEALAQEHLADKSTKRRRQPILPADQLPLSDTQSPRSQLGIKGKKTEDKLFEARLRAPRFATRTDIQRFAPPHDLSSQTQT